MSKNIRLAIFLTHPVQYFVPVFRELEKNKDLDMEVFYGCNHGVTKTFDPNFGLSFKWDIDLTSGYKHRFISKLKINDLKGIKGFNLSLKACKEIVQFSPNYVLVFSYSPIFIAFTTLLLKLSGKRIILRAEATDKALKRSYFKSFLRDLVLKSYYKLFDYFFPISLDSQDHYKRLGVSSNKLKLVNYSIDVDFFNNQVKKWTSKRSQLRDKYKIKKSDYVFLYCAKIYPPKNPILIADALSLIPNNLKERIWLFVVGDGILRQTLESKVNKEIHDRSVFLGFKNQSELGQYYSLSDALILPSISGETWGLVVNEALQFGKKVLLSNNVGCSRDLVHNLETGYIFENNNKNDLANGIKKLAEMNNKKIKIKKLPHPADLSNAVNEFLLNN